MKSEIFPLLSKLKWRIRAYVAVEGLSLAVIWLGVTFWLGLAVDYLPIMMGAEEMPRLARGVLLALISVISVFILYRWSISRLLTRLSNKSMAILVERQNLDFNNSLITIVEMSEKNQGKYAEYHSDMLRNVEQKVGSKSNNVNLGHVLNYFPLWRNIIGALVVLFTIVLFAWFSEDAFATWTNRLYQLKDDTWPRRARIELVGVEVPCILETDTIRNQPQVGIKIIPFKERQVRIARGTNSKLIARADVGFRVVPQSCEVSYRSGNSDRGRIQMQADGSYRNGFQYYSLNRFPFKNIDENLSFDVRGYDHRVNGYFLEVVDAPVVLETTVNYQLPAYLADSNDSLGRLVKGIPLAAGLQVERGSKVEIISTCNKNLRHVLIYDHLTNITTKYHFDENHIESNEFRYNIESLQQDVLLSVMLVDSDDLITETPFPIAFKVKQDELPRVEVKLRGIGSAITALARIPAFGKISDDHQIERSWFDCKINEQQEIQSPIVVSQEEIINALLDLRDYRRQGEANLQLQPGDRLLLSVKAKDKYDLSDGPHISKSDTYQLEIVTTDKLLSLLDAREAGLRERLEQIIEEMSRARDSLIQLNVDLKKHIGSGKITESSNNNPLEEKTDIDDSESNIQQFRIQHVIQQSQKSAQEIYSVAVSIEGIREELINNRVDSKERRDRLKEQISDPLLNIYENEFPTLKILLTSIEKEDLDPAMVSEQCIEQADILISELQEILQKMIEIGSFNEVVELIRTILEDQEELLKKTKKHRVLDLQN